MWRIPGFAAVVVLLGLTHCVVANDAGTCECVSFSFLNCSAREMISIPHLDVIECGEDVQTIDASWNQLDDLDGSLDEWIGDTLNVSHNKIEYMDHFTGEHLKEIDVSSNELIEFDAELMTNLEKLWANENKLNEFVLPVDTCRLQRVNVSKNHLKGLDHDFSICEELVHFDASHNFIDDLSLEVLNLIKTEGSRSVVFDLRNNPLPKAAVVASFKEFGVPFEVLVNDTDCTCASFKGEESTLTLCVSAMCPDGNELWSSLEEVKNESPMATESNNAKLQDLATTSIKAESDWIPPEDPIETESDLILPEAPIPKAQETTAIQELTTTLGTTTNTQNSSSTLEYTTDFKVTTLVPSPGGGTEAPLELQPSGSSAEPPPPPLPSPSLSPPNAPRAPILPTLPPRPEPSSLPTLAPTTSAPVRESRRRRRLIVSLMLTAVGLVIAAGCAGGLVFAYRRRRRQIDREAARAPHALQPLVSDTTPRFMRNNDFVS